MRVKWNNISFCFLIEYNAFIRDSDYFSIRVIVTISILMCWPFFDTWPFTLGKYIVHTVARIYNVYTVQCTPINNSAMRYKADNIYLMKAFWQIFGIHIYIYIFACDWLCDGMKILLCLIYILHKIQSNIARHRHRIHGSFRIAAKISLINVQENSVIPYRQWKSQYLSIYFPEWYFQDASNFWFS